MHTIINAEDIKTGNRQRKEFKSDALRDLADSILRVGLIHAPVLEARSNVLIAGERRIRAMALLGNQSFAYGDEFFTYPDIPIHQIARDDPELLFEIELEENLRRENLTPMEEAQALAALHHIRTQEEPKQTVKDTAKEVSQLRGKKHTQWDEMRLADAILVDNFKDDPDVQKAAKQSIQKGAKIAKKKMELEFTQMLNRMEGGDTNPLFSVLPGDCREILHTLEAGSFDILLFDPPYGVDAGKFGEQAFGLGHQYMDDEKSAEALTFTILYQSQNFLKPDAHVLMFCAFERWDFWREYISNDLAYAVWPRPLIWYKGQQAHAPVPDGGPRYSYECILFARKGGRKIRTLINDVLIHSATRDKIHAAEKPDSLLAELIDFVAGPGDRIIDPTVGSGSIFLGAKGREVYVTGIEADPNYYAIAKERAK